MPGKGPNLVMTGAEDQDGLPVSRELGDYRLLELICEGTDTCTYRARQTSVGREVVLERIKGEGWPTPERVRSFLADVRAKAAVAHAGIGSVYEAVEGEGEVYYTRELLAGRTFDELQDKGVKLDPVEVAGILHQLGAAMHYLTDRGVATLPLEAGHMVLSGQGLVRIANPGIAAEPDPAGGVLDRALVGELLQGLVRAGKPGATRTSKLLGMMRGLEEGVELSWRQVYHTAQKLEQELAAEICVARAEALREAGGDGRGLRTFGWALLAVMMAGIFGVGGLILLRRPKAAEVRDMSAMIEIPAGIYLGGNGLERRVDRFWIDAHEVTIAEYAEFLEALAGLEEDKRDAYDHIDQPTSKPDHEPDGWASILSVARSGGRFEGLELGLNCPVTCIDWWDAYAYASWKGGRLPSLDEWMAAASVGTGPEPVPSEWGPADQKTGDVTGRGIHGLAGNVSEWLQKPERNPAFPMNARSPVAGGGSFLKAGLGTRERSWFETRGVRRPELGFRVLRETSP